MSQQLLKGLSVTVSLCLLHLTCFAADVEVTGRVKVEVYANGSFNGNDGGMAGTAIADLTNHPSYPDSPVRIEFPPIAEYPFAVDAEGNATFPPGDVSNNYGVRMSGFLHPPASGEWFFYIASDDASQLYISTDENPANAVLVASESNWSDRRYYFNVEREWPGQPTPRGDNWGTDKRDDTQVPMITADGRYKTSNVSDPITMTEGGKYYFYALMKEGGGTDDISIWATQDPNPLDTLLTDYPGYPADGEQPVPLTGDWISAVGSDTTVITEQPQDLTVLEKRPFSFSVKVSPAINAGVLTFNWFKDGSEVGDLNGNPINSPTLDSSLLGFDPPLVAELADNNSQWTVQITPENGPVLMSEPATLRVTTDATPPVVTRAVGSDDFNAVTLFFDEDMDLGAFDPNNYSLSGGLQVNGVIQLGPRAVAISTSQQDVGTDYTVTLAAGVQDTSGNSVAAPRTVNFHSFELLKGAVGYGRWPGATGLDDLRGLIASGVPPGVSETLTRMVSPVDVADNYGGRLRTVWTAPRSGDIIVWISSDDPGAGYISTDASPENRILVASEPVWNGSAEFIAPQDGNNIQRNRPGCGTVDESVPPGGCENRSDQWDLGEWSERDPITGKQEISVTAGQKYYVEVLWREGGGGDNGAMTITYTDESTPANGSTTLAGDAVEWYADVDDVPIITVPPEGKVFEKGEDITLSVTALGHQPLSYQWYKNKKPIASGTNATLAITDADVDDIGDYSVTITNDRGSATTRGTADNGARLVMMGAIVIEAEDYNHGGGMSVAAASTMPLAADLYRGLDGLPGIDFLLVNQSTTDPAVNGNAYRNGWISNSVNVPFPTTPTPLGNVDVTGDDGNGGSPGANNNVRPDFTLTSNYKIGWGDTGEWYNYTRNFAQGTYAAVAAISSDTLNDDRVGTTLSIVTGDVATTNQVATEVGRFTGVGTGNWSSLDLIPFEDPSGNLATFTLGPDTTVRWTLLQGHDLDYMLFYPATPGPGGPGVSVENLPGGMIQITWEGVALQRSTTVTGGYADIPGAAKPYQVQPSGASEFFRARLE
jgi:hypothetical protein